MEASERIEQILDFWLAEKDTAGQATARNCGASRTPASIGRFPTAMQSWDGKPRRKNWNS